MKGYIVESRETLGALHEGYDLFKGDILVRDRSTFTLTIEVSGEFDRRMMNGKLVDIVVDDPNDAKRTEDAPATAKTIGGAATESAP